MLLLPDSLGPFPSSLPPDQSPEKACPFVSVVSTSGRHIDILASMGSARGAMVRFRAGLEADTKGRTNSSEAFSLKGDRFREEERAEMWS